MHHLEDSGIGEIYQKLTEIFHDVFDDDTIVLCPELTAAGVEGWDSLTHIRVVLNVERAFRVRFNAAEVARLKNVGEFVESIKAKL
jgi:acyl carrier protein